MHFISFRFVVEDAQGRPIYDLTLEDEKQKGHNPCRRPFRIYTKTAFHRNGFSEFTHFIDEIVLLKDS
jgi:hypothetical protein